MLITPIKTKIFHEREDLFAFIRAHVPKLREGSILVTTSKIVALSEGRTAPLTSKRHKEALIKKESDWAIKTKLVWLTVRQGLVMASAGIDESNANGKLILLPKDSFKAAATLRKKLQKAYRIKRLGVILTDSRLFPLRAGVVGVAMGYAGFKGLKNYISKADLFGRRFKFEKVDVADSIATAAVLTMGEGRERKPLAVVTGALVEFTDRINRRELIIDIKKDVYRPLFLKATSSKKR